MKIVELILLFISIVTMFFILNLVKKIKNRTLIHKEYMALNIALIIYAFGLFLQIIFFKKPIQPSKFEYLSIIGMANSPVISFYFALTYYNEKINIRRLWYFMIIPVITIVLLFLKPETIFKVYSVNTAEMIYGKWFVIHSGYTYIMYLIAIIIIMYSSIKKSGFLSSQSLTIITGALVPIIINALIIGDILKGNIYITPILFTFTAICFYIAIFKLKALNIIPVTFRTIIDTMSDSFVVVSDDGTISDLNKTFINTFKPIADVKDKDNFFDLIESTGIADLNKIKKDIAETREKDMLITKEYHLQKGDFDRYLEIDCQPIKAKSGNEYIATLILIRDITTQKRDMEIMTKNENLVILGELAGGVAHDINTPISAIKSGLLMFNDLVKTDDQKMLLKNMNSCVDKITNLVNSLRNQIRNIGSDEKTKISIKSIVDDIYVILHNELNKNNIELKVDIKEDIFLIGNSTKLSQVITNIIMNAIQAYEGKQGDIKLSVYTSDKNEAIIRVEDHAGGIPESVSPYIFKNILTTKGVSGTGFGLYLAYSVIKGAFGGEILFDTKIGEGTVFYIVIPLNI